MERSSSHLSVILGLDPRIHAAPAAWMVASDPTMTEEGVTPETNRRHERRFFVEAFQPASNRL